jgi:hypothetical protein
MQTGVLQRSHKRFSAAADMGTVNKIGGGMFSFIPPLPAVPQFLN